MKIKYCDLCGQECGDDYAIHYDDATELYECANCQPQDIDYDVEEEIEMWFEDYDWRDEK